MRTNQQYQIVNPKQPKRSLYFFFPQFLRKENKKFKFSKKIMTSLPSTSTLPHSSDTELTHILDLLFEPSPPLHALTLPVLRSTTFPSYDVLIAAINAQLGALAASDKPEDVSRLSDILCSHPRLGAKNVDSEQSRKEQAQLQSGGEEEKEKLARLNQKYEERFPGLRYV